MTFGAHNLVHSEPFLDYRYEIGGAENAGPENAGPENAGPNRRA